MVNIIARVAKSVNAGDLKAIELHLQAYDFIDFKNLVSPFCVPYGDTRTRVA